MADSEEAVLLQRRARRRLVGAVALALLVIIVIPIVFDREPKPITQDLVIEIPSQDSSKFNPRLLPQPPAEAPASKPEATVPQEAAKSAEPVAALESKPEPPKVETPKAEPKAEPKGETAKAAAKPEAPKAAAKVEMPKAEAPKPKAESSKAEVAAKAPPKESAGEFVIPLGLFSKPENAKRMQSDAAKAGFKVFSETVKGAKGELVRVRAGPYPSREAAEQAREKLKSKGVNVGAVVPRDP